MEKARDSWKGNLPPVLQEEVPRGLNGAQESAGVATLSCLQRRLCQICAQNSVKLRDAMLALDGQSDLLAQQNQECQDRIQALQMEIKALSEQIAGPEAKQKNRY